MKRIWSTLFGTKPTNIFHLKICNLLLVATLNRIADPKTKIFIRYIDFKGLISVITSI